MSNEVWPWIHDLNTLDLVVVRAACKRETPIEDAETIAQCDRELKRREAEAVKDE